MSLARLDGLDGAPRIGLGLAALGRPAYITLGRERDLPSERSVAVMRERSHEVLDAAYARGVRYFDVARSYGRAEEFLASWLDGKPNAVVGSKWGYTYVAGWRTEVEVHERKDHGVATFERQLAETRALLGGRLDLYQIHSVTPDSTALTDASLHRRLAALAAEGVTIGLSVSGPGQGAAVEAALGIEVDGVPLFGAVQATWNLLEPSAGPALAAAHDAGLTVIVKEALANGRLAGGLVGAGGGVVGAGVPADGGVAGLGVPADGGVAGLGAPTHGGVVGSGVPADGGVAGLGAPTKGGVVGSGAPTHGGFVGSSAPTSGGFVGSEAQAEGGAGGRLAGFGAPARVVAVAAELGVPVDALALAAVLRQPWVDVVLSGAVTVEQVDANVRALSVHLKKPELEGLDAVAEPVDDYWRRRSALPWR